MIRRGLWLGLALAVMTALPAPAHHNGAADIDVITTATTTFTTQKGNTCDQQVTEHPETVDRLIFDGRRYPLPEGLRGRGPSG